MLSHQATAGGRRPRLWALDPPWGGFANVFPNSQIRYSILLTPKRRGFSFNLFSHRCAVGGVDPLLPPPLLFYPFLFMLGRSLLRPCGSSVGSPRFSFKTKIISLGARFGRAVYPKFIFNNVSLTSALLLERVHHGRGRRTATKTESARMVEIGRFSVVD